MISDFRISKPIPNCEDRHSSKDDASIIHVTSGHRKDGGEVEEDENDNCKSHSHGIGEPSERAQLEVASTRQIDFRALAVHNQRRWESVTDLLQDQSGANHGIECCRGSKVDAADDENYTSICDQSPDWDAETWVDPAQEFGAHKSIVSGHRPAQPRSSLLAAYHGEESTACQNNEEESGNRFGLGRLYPQLVDRNSSRRAQDGIEVLHAVQHGDDEGEARDESNADCRHQCLRYHFGGMLALLGQVYGSIYTGVDVVRVDEAYEENDTVRCPTRVVLEVHPNELA